LHKEAPPYLSDLLEHKPSSAHHLRSNCDDLKLTVPPTKCKTFADRAFSVYGPNIWNSLPYYIRCSPNLDDFKKKLKTFLFVK
jgi:hypothetical protein